MKWKPVARVSLLIVFFVLTGFAEALNATLDTWWGYLLSLTAAMSNIWASLFGLEADNSRCRAAGVDRLADPRRRLRARPLAALPAHPRLRGGPMTADLTCGQASDRRPPGDLRERLQVLRRRARGQPGQPVDPAGDHRPRGAERLGQDDADEPDGRADPAVAGAGLGAGAGAGRAGGALPPGRLRRAVRLLPAGPDRLPVRRVLPAGARLRRQAGRGDGLEGDRAGGAGRGRRPQGGRLQQGDAAAHPARPGARPRARRCWCSTSRSTASTRWPAPR